MVQKTLPAGALTKLYRVNVADYAITEHNVVDASQTRYSGQNDWTISNYTLDNGEMLNASNVNDPLMWIKSRTWEKAFYSTRELAESEVEWELQKEQSREMLELWFEKQQKLLLKKLEQQKTHHTDELEKQIAEQEKTGQKKHLQRRAIKLPIVTEQEVH